MPGAGRARAPRPTLATRSARCAPVPVPGLGGRAFPGSVRRRRRSGFRPRPFGASLLLAALLALGACDTPAEKAEAHYQRALALLAEGDTARAALEFRNVFRLDEAHSAARFAYAGLLRDRGDTGGALSQLQRLVEQDRRTSKAS